MSRRGHAEAMPRDGSQGEKCRQGGPCRGVAETPAEIVLATLNARYIHSALGLRCLRANLGDLRERCRILEFDIQQRPADIVEELLAARPKIIGFGVSIWNTTPTTEVVELLKQLAPEVTVVLGGPEVSHGTEGMEIARHADHVLAGEADLAFAELCEKLLGGESPPKHLAAPLPDLARLASPYDEYTADDIAHRVIYVEASRGCPFSCEFCLSSVDEPVRAFPLDPFLAEMGKLLDRGARHLKFLDRTFNLNPRAGAAILSFLLDRWRPGMMFHFEMVPDRFPEALREWIVRFPPGALQFEVGIQTFDEATAARISRRQNLARLEDNLRFLREHTGVHVHADLIAGLPGESLESFAAGFDRLWRLGPQEIQVGILKRLRGTPITRHDAEFAMVHARRPPYELLSNRDLDFTTLQDLKRFARFWDLAGNSGRFPRTLPMLLEHPGHASPFRNFREFSRRLFDCHGKQHGISPQHLGEQLYRHLLDLGVDEAEVRAALAADHLAGGGRGLPGYLRAAGEPPDAPPDPPRTRGEGLQRRQQRHRRTGRAPDTPPSRAPA